MVELYCRKVDSLLNIKRQETYELAQELAHLTGENMTTAVTVALQERIIRLRSSKRQISLSDELLAIGRECAERLGERTIPDHDDYLYDKTTGLPK